MTLRKLLRQAGNLLVRLGEPPRPEVLTDRNQLLREDVRRESDSCGYFREGEPGMGECDSDGHYLCSQCAQMSHFESHRRGLLHCRDCAGEV